MSDNATTEISSNSSRLMSVKERIRHRKLVASRPRQRAPSSNPWIIALKNTRSKFPYMSLKEAMVYTKQHYTRSGKTQPQTTTATTEIETATASTV